MSLDASTFAATLSLVLSHSRATLPSQVLMWRVLWIWTSRRCRAPQNILISISQGEGGNRIAEGFSHVKGKHEIRMDKSTVMPADGGAAKRAAAMITVGMSNMTRRRA